MGWYDGYFGADERYLRLSLEMCSTSHRWMIDCAGVCGFRPRCLPGARETLTTITTQNIAVHGFVRRQSDLIPHQLYIAHEVSSRFAPRRVALRSGWIGKKPSEACLIPPSVVGWQANITGTAFLFPKSFGASVVCGSLRKFNLWSIFFDDRSVALLLKKGRPKGNPFLGWISWWFVASSLAGFWKNETKQAVSANWGHVWGWTKAHHSNGQ